MLKLSYWLDKLGASGILLGPAETVSRLVASGQYTGPEQIDEGIGILAGDLVAWNTSKYIQERKEARSPLVHIGRVLEAGGTVATEYALQTGCADNIYRVFNPAALGISTGAFLEYVAGPIHENYYNY